MFFGNRHKDKDYLHKEQLERWANDGYITLSTAFSRDQEYKVYVQHRMKENSKQLYELLSNEFERVRIFLCGSAKQLPKCIEQTFVEILQEELGSKEQAEQIVATLMKRNQYVLEVWS